MNATQLHATLLRTFAKRIPDITEGASGLGKTEIKHQVAQELGYSSLLLHPATLDQVDLGGYPLTVERDGDKRIVRCFDDLLSEVFDSKTPTLLHIDEIGQADHSVQKAVAPFVSPERRINNHRLPECVAVSLSTNSAVHRTGSVPILVHIRSRVGTTLHLEPNLDAFLARATKDNIHPYVMSFLKHNPAMLYELEMLPKKIRDERGLTYDKVFTSGEGYTCPRSWYRINELMDAQVPVDVEDEVFSGAIGSVAAPLFTAHCRHSKQNLDMESIILRGNDNWSFPDAKEPGLRWSFCYGAAALAEHTTLGRVFEVANRLCSEKHAEYGMLIAQQSMAKGNWTLTHKEFLKFCKSPLGKLVQGVKL